MTGKAARLFDYLTDKEKEYVAVCAFGSRTDTQDATGEILETGENYPDREEIFRAAAELTGDIRQVPSIYSAIKVGGKPLYLRARKGENVEVPERMVHIESIEVLREMPDHGKYSVPSPEKKQSALPAKILNGPEGRTAERPEVCKPYNGTVQHQQLDQPSQCQPDPLLPAVRFFPRPQRCCDQAEEQAHA